MRLSRTLLTGLATLASFAACNSNSESDGPSILAGHIVFSRIAADSSSDLYFMNLDGSEVSLLRDSLGLSLVIPRVSPDGSRMAVLGFPTAGGTQSLYMLSPAGAVEFIPRTFGGGPGSWSPNGKKLAFACVDSSPVGGEDIHGICVVDADGDNLTRINHSTFASFEPSWSPNGQRIAFVNDSSGNFDLYTMNLQGGDVVQLTATPGGEWTPSWSPDGTSLAYWRRDGMNSTDPSEIYVVSATGGVSRAVTTLGDAVGPSWSPDGTEIAFASGGKIQAVRPDSTGLRELTDGAVVSAWPSWGP
jgi:Tol biopolymer transport system component